MTTTSRPAPESRPVAGAATEPAAGRRRLPRPSWLVRHEVGVLRANLVAQIGIVVTGGAVRLTGSGLGCSTWPQCEPGQFTPVLHEATSFHPFIEFGNRTLTGVLAVLAIATALVVWGDRERARPYRLLGLVPLIGVVVQAVVGGLTVLVDLHPGWVGFHFLLSMVLVAASTALLVRRRETDAAPRDVVSGLPRLAGRALVPLSVLVIALGVVVTGSGPYSGDDEVAYRFAVDPVLVARVHAGSVWAYLAVLVAFVLLVRSARSATDGATRPSGVVALSRATAVLVVVTLAQGLLGYVQYFTGLPEVLVATHMLGAGLLVVAQTRHTLALRERGVRTPA